MKSYTRRRLVFIGKIMDPYNTVPRILYFSSTSESQSAQTEQLSSGSEGINELSAKLLKLAKELTVQWTTLNCFDDIKSIKGAKFGLYLTGLFFLEGKLGDNFPTQ